MAEKTFASQADLEEKQISFDKLSEHAYAYTAAGRSEHRCGDR